MNHFKKILLSISFSILYIFTFSQDFHLSQYWVSPLNTNPALTGSVAENLRFSATYRNQWFHFNSFKVYNFSADANLFKAKMNGNYLGVGINFSQEIEGENSFKNTKAILSFAYNKNFVKKTITHNFSIGFNTSYTLKQLNFIDLVYGNLYEKNNNYDPIKTSDYQNKSFMDLGVGVNYVIVLKNKYLFNLGFSVMNILAENYDYGTFNEVLVYRKYILNFNSRLYLNEKIAIIPLVFFQSQGPHLELDLGSYFKYEINKNSNTAIYLGLQYRLVSYQDLKLGNDALISGLRIKYRKIDLGLTYDFTISNLRKSEFLVGSPEVNVSYAFSFKKTNSIINCPNF